MYVTRLRLNPRHPQARRDLSSAYEMHRSLSRAFVDSAKAQPHRFLWRLESTTPGSATDEFARVLIQSSRSGQWEALSDRADYLHATPQEKKVDLDTLLVPGRSCIFRLVCNPTVTRDGKRLGLMREEEQLAWLQRQAEKHGFEVGGARVSRSERMSWRQGRDGHRITVQVVQFDGLLEVRDAALVADVLCAGLGHAKALGLGMLSLAPRPSAAACSSCAD
jgi:CRISPR system Cascade subunit CasE